MSSGADLRRISRDRGDRSHPRASKNADPQTHQRSPATMSLTRVHNFSISLDGYGTGEGLTLEAPFGHAGHRLHEWMFATRWARLELLGQPGGASGLDDAFARAHGVGIG